MEEYSGLSVVRDAGSNFRKLFGEGGREGPFQVIQVVVRRDGTIAADIRRESKEPPGGIGPVAFGECHASQHGFRVAPVPLDIEKP